MACIQAAHDFLSSNYKLRSLRDVIINNADLGDKTDFTIEIARIEKNYETKKMQK